MAIVSIPLLGRASGRFADAEFMRLGGRNILRSKKLKRYKPVNSVNRYYQQLLKKIIVSLSPVFPFLSLSYTLTSKYLNYCNQWVKDNYNLFSLNSLEYLICSDITKLKFSTPQFICNVTASIFSYTGLQLIMSTDLSAVYLTGDYEFYLILSTGNMRSTIMNLAGIYDVSSKQLIYYYTEPPFNSADYHVFLVLKNKITGLFSNTNYLFAFVHG